MTDRTLPHACNVANRANTALRDAGLPVLADELATMHRATCDLVHALHAEREATTAPAQHAAQVIQHTAIARLRDGVRTPGDPRFTAPDVPSPRYVQRLRDTTHAIHIAAALADTNEA